MNGIGTLRTKMPLVKREYELPFSSSVYDDIAVETERILIEGYKVIFDKKVRTVPSEIAEINQLTI